MSRVALQDHNGATSTGPRTTGPLTTCSDNWCPVKQPEGVENKDVDANLKKFFIHLKWPSDNYNEYNRSCSDPVSDWLSQL